MEKSEQENVKRLVNLENLLCQNPTGLTLEEMADECDVTTRTIRRDLEALEEIYVPILQRGDRYTVQPGHFLPPMRFTLPETMTLFLAVRLLLKYGNAHNPNVQTTFRRLSHIVEEPLKSQIHKTIDWMQRQKKDERFVHHMNVLTDAWMKGIPASIRYQSLPSDKAEERVIEPYFIEPAAFEHANYVVGYCRARKGIRTFKIERIESARLLPNEKYTVPADFDANQYLGSAWGITVHGEAGTVKLKFNKELARVARETEWHPSQVTKLQPDGSAIVAMTVTASQELVNFITGWGDGVEVLEPASLRERVAATARSMVKLYGKKT